MSILNRVLPEPSFVVRDPQAVVREMVSQYESLTGKTLYPGQVERVLIDVMAYRESLVRENLQDAAKLNLVRYSRAPMLDFLAENVGVARLPAQAARCTLRFAFDPVPSINALIPAGTVVSVGEVRFATQEGVIIAAGAANKDVVAVCTEAGTLGNGFVGGQVSNLVGALNGLSVASVTNIDTTAGGANAEDDEHLRERVVLAPEQFSNAGSVGAYRFYALSAHPDVVQVAVTSPSPGQVNLYPLTPDGAPSDAVKQAVLSVCSADKVRPLTDHVQVLDPVVVDYAINASLTLLVGADAGAALAQARSAAQKYKDAMRSALGKDIVRDDLIYALKGYGVYQVGLINPQNKVLQRHHWARCTGINITVAGVVEG